MHHRSTLYLSRLLFIFNNILKVVWTEQIHITDNHFCFVIQKEIKLKQDGNYVHCNFLIVKMDLTTLVVLKSRCQYQYQYHIYFGHITALLNDTQPL